MLVEIVLAIEQTFEISIPDEVAERVVTVDDLCRLVTSQLGEVRRATLEDAVFYRLRRALMTVCHVPRGQLTPKARLEPLLPDAPLRGQKEGSRAEIWRALGREIGAPLPALRRPAWMETTIALGTSLPAGAGAIALGHRSWSTAVALGALAWLTLRGSMRATSGWADRIPPSCETLGTTTRALVTSHYTTLSGVTKRAHPTEVYRLVRTIIAEHLGLPEDRIHPQATLVGELGAD